ncbi:MAG: TetR/AcrR family transcriptional regulator [Candidatus Accumulibacter sp.]|jgi:AcrR family transcriptional regulator|nr:TetR/AcrR family transcriptional regulator [Accumulibacter sp.]
MHQGKGADETVKRQTSGAAPKPRRMNAAERHAALLRAARELSIEQGVMAPSLDAIIQRAGGSRRSIYTEFGGKDGLRDALMAEISAEVLPATTLDARQEGDLRATLKQFARNLIATLTSAHGTVLSWIILQGVFFSPERARNFLEQGPGRGAKLLAERLEVARAQGEIEVRDCLAAANLFIGMVRGNLYLERVLQLRPPPGEEEIEAHVDTVVDIFLNGLRPR